MPFALRPALMKTAWQSASLDNTIKHRGAGGAARGDEGEGKNRGVSLQSLQKTCHVSGPRCAEIHCTQHENF